MEKPEDKKTLILDAAMKVFASEGYHKAKISKISEIAGVGAGTVYLYYKNKENILEELFVRAWTRIESLLIGLTEKNNKSAKESVEEMLNTVLYIVSENKDFARMVLHEYTFWSSGKNEKVSRIMDNIQKLVISIFETGIKNKEFRSDLSPKSLTVYMIGGLWHLLAYCAENTDFNVEKISKEVELIVFKGIL